jgi:hypothetical protein
MSARGRIASIIREKRINSMILLYNLMCLLINKFLEIMVSQARWQTTRYYLFFLGLIELLKDRLSVLHLSLINEKRL